MLKAINTKVLISGAVILAAAALVIGGTFAFFSDTETSVDNTFVAGAIDLKIDNESYAIDHNIPGFENPTGALVVSEDTSWQLTDLTIEKFFDFVDLKPGDIGEDTISVHVNDNDAWLCAAARVTVNSDETCVDPENTDENGACIVEVDGTNGDLAEEVNFAFWKDDGDNVYEPVAGQNGGVAETVFLAGPIRGLNGAGQIALADTSANSVFGHNVPVDGGTDVFIGKAWCFGALSSTNLVQDGLNTGDPISLGTGFNCNGSAANNAAQTDKVVGDIQFYAEQSRNNSTFTCAQNYTPVWPTPTPEN